MQTSKEVFNLGVIITILSLVLLYEALMPLSMPGKTPKAKAV